MTPRISIEKGENFVHSRILGPITLELLAELMTKTSAKAEEWGFYRFLADFRGAEKRMGALEDYNMAHKQAMEYGLKPGGSRHALIVRQEDMDEFDFVETVFRNAGYTLRVFSEEAPAIDWLRK